MQKNELVSKIEIFAPLELTEKWDCSGWLVETSKTYINKVLLCLTVTNEIIKQAKDLNCDMIISHHPLFSVPLDWKDIDIYCAHTNMDRANGGTTDTLIKTLGLRVSKIDDFVRYVDIEISFAELYKKLKKISSNLRFVNNNNKTIFKRIAFCAGSGSEFINLAYKNGADCFVTGDLKFHTVIESPIPVFDIGHFESEIGVLQVFKDLIDVETIFASEKSPFQY